jgi:CheY-like chemotaxis protein
VTTILQVEDDPNDVLFLRRALKKAGVTNPVQSVEDGQQAIDYLRGAGPFADRCKFPFPGLLLLDLKLPYVMGLDVLRWIRQELQTPLVVIILTASAENTDIAAAYRLGVNGFLVKPSETAKLEEMIKAFKDFWLTHNTLPPESYREPKAVLSCSPTVAPGATPARLAADVPPLGPTAEAVGQPTSVGVAAFVERDLESAPNTLSLFAPDIDSETDGSP